MELGARAQAMRRGTLFAARANKLYRQHGSLDELDETTRSTIEGLLPA